MDFIAPDSKTGPGLARHARAAGAAAHSARPSVAVIGAGISGLTAAYLLSGTHDVTLFEAEGRLGGHAHTHDVTDSDGRQHAVDSGFIVHNDVTYPWLRKLFGELAIDVRPTEMSMSVRCEGCGLEYAGGRGLRGVFAQPRRLVDPRFIRLLWQVRRFHRRALAFLRATDDDNLMTYGEFLEREGFSDYFTAHYAVPVVSCVWSAGREKTLLYPARYLFRFLDNHGLLRVAWATPACRSRQTSRTTWRWAASGSVTGDECSCWPTPGCWAMCSIRCRFSGAMTPPESSSASSQRFITPTESDTPTCYGGTRRGMP